MNKKKKEDETNKYSEMKRERERGSERAKERTNDRRKRRGENI
jgi:hypothetical protein